MDNPTILVILFALVLVGALVVMVLAWGILLTCIREAPEVAVRTRRTTRAVRMANSK